MKIKGKIAAAAVLATGLLGVGLPAASAHTGDLKTSGVCQDDGTRLVTYTGATTNVPAEGSGHEASLTVEFKPIDTEASPISQTVVGNTTYTFTQIIAGNVKSVSADAHLAWGDGVKSDPTATAEFTTDCTPVVVPDKPAPVVVVIASDSRDCDSKVVTITTVTTTTGWVLVDNAWVKDKPVTTEAVTTRDATLEECPVVTPPVVTPPVVTPPVVTPPVVTPPVAVAGVVAEAPAAAAVNPLPVAAAAGQADTSGQLVAGGFAAFAAFLLLGAGFVLRRRHGVL